MQITHELDQKFQRLFSGRQLQQFYDILIAQVDDTTWVMYNTYHIKKIHDQYQVRSNNIQQHTVFNSLRNAATYVIFHWGVHMQDCAAILFCDNRIASLENEIKLYNKLIKSSNGSVQLSIYAAKRQQCETQIAAHRRSLMHYIYRGYELQQKKFRKKV